MCSLNPSNAGSHKYYHFQLYWLNLLTSNILLPSEDKWNKIRPVLVDPGRMVQGTFFSRDVLLLYTQGSRKCEWFETRVMQSEPPPFFYFFRGKALGLRQRQDWRHWFGSLLGEVRQLSEDLWQPRHWAGWLTRSFRTREVINSWVLEAPEVKSHNVSSLSLPGWSPQRETASLMWMCRFGSMRVTGDILEQNCWH